MEQRILNYRRYIDGQLTKEDMDWERLREEHLTQIGFFQHERLIHLIVTGLFALLTILAVCMSCLAIEAGSSCGIAFLLLAAALLVLLIPYIRHYYILENEVQKMYKQYDVIVTKAGRSEFQP